MYQWIYFYQQVGRDPGTDRPPRGVSELFEDEDDENHNVTPHYLGGSVKPENKPNTFQTQKKSNQEQHAEA